MGQSTPEVLEDLSSMYRTNYMGFASFTMLIWDHVDTFEREVEHIWKAKKNLLTICFLINRYLTPLGFIVNLFAYLAPVWTEETCSRFIRFEGSMTVIGINIVALMMFIRIKALYHRQYVIQGIVAFLGLFEFTMNAFLLTRGVAVVHNKNSGVHACTMIFDPSISVLASSSAWLPLLYDTVVLALTLYRTLPQLRNKKGSYVMKRLFQDGLIYYTAIFAVTAVLTFMIVWAPPGLKNITAQLELLLTVTMMSRITINLKTSVHKMKNTAIIRPELPSMFTQQTHMNIASNIKIVTPGFNQTTTDTVDFGVEMATSSLRRNSTDKVGSGKNAITIVAPPSKRQRLSTIPQESSDWEYSVESPSDGRSPISRTRSDSSRDRLGDGQWQSQTFDTMGLDTISESKPTDV